MSIQAFDPIVNVNSKVLLLGTMPGIQSLKLGQYYGHKGNHFWKIIFALFEMPISNDYIVRKQLLLANRIALWDVLQSCEREGSSDKKIKYEKANDFELFLNTYPKIRNVFFTSLKAKALFERCSIKTFGVEFHVLPSPSSANTWKSFSEKLDRWKLILQYL